MEKKRFHISYIILSVVLIAAWIYITYFYISMIIDTMFYWLNFLYLPIYLFLTYILFINSIKLIIEELKKLGKKQHES